MAPVIDANNRGPLINIGIWLSLVTACIAVATKVWIKLASLRRLQLDDAYILLALVRHISQDYISCHLFNQRRVLTSFVLSL